MNKFVKLVCISVASSACFAAGKIVFDFFMWLADYFKNTPSTEGWFAAAGFAVGICVAAWVYYKVYSFLKEKILE